MASRSRAARAELALRPIGHVESPFRQASGTPIQPIFADGAEGVLVLGDVYEAALEDIDGFERLWLIYWLDRADGYRPRVLPYRDRREHGLFATRAPCRPNPIGLSVVRLLGRDGPRLRVADLDVLDGTPLLDVKPYIAKYDAHPLARAGWLEDSTSRRTRADGRFHRRGR
jgi:tRNA-Thr(GGU) m(6)t(6)A37 methyltransferase TsaA